MIIDGRCLAADQELKADVCIVGSGPAGLTVAQELQEANLSIIIVESGGWNYEQAAQSLNEGIILAPEHIDISASRRRQVGGNAHVWNAPIKRGKPGWRCLTLDEIDFEARVDIYRDGWPFSRQHLVPYYYRALKASGLKSFSHNLEDWQTRHNPQLFSDSGLLATTISQYAPSSIFTTHYPAQLKHSSNIKILTHSTVVNIETNSSGKQVLHLDVSSLAGNNFKVLGRQFIVAAGGIENARLLLLSNSHFPEGLGNQHDLVGRYFMDHPQVKIGTFTPFSKKFFSRSILYDIHQVNQSAILGAIHLSKSTILEKNLLNHAIHSYPAYLGNLSQAKQSLEMMRRDFSQGKIPDKLSRHILDLIDGQEYLYGAIFWKICRLFLNPQLGKWSFIPWEKMRFSTLQLICQLEQLPQSSNRLTLTRDKDSLGLNKAELAWRLSGFELNSIAKIVAILQRELNSSGLGIFHPDEDLPLQDFAAVSGFHHLGTTRMSSSPRCGVVDSDCRVHGVSNLFLAGSSVFPTGGYANPTFTIVALALRLSDKIKSMLQ